jgi:hypothetical protein
MMNVPRSCWTMAANPLTRLFSLLAPGRWQEEIRRARNADSNTSTITFFVEKQSKEDK